MSATEGTLGAGNTQKPGLSKDDVRDLFREFTQNRNMTPEQGGAQLMADNAELRADKRRLKDKVEDLEKRQVPDGALVLTGDKIKLHNDLMALLGEGQKPEDLAALLKEHPLLKVEVADLKMQSVAVQIAEEEGWKSSVLLELTKGKKLALEEVDEEVDDEENEGKKKRVRVKRGFEVTADDKGVETKTRLSERLKNFIPSLVKDENEEGSEEEQSAASATGTPYVRQSQGSKAAPANQKASTRVMSKYKRRDKK